MPYLYRRDTSSFDRGLAFFDAVYGFALTLLVVNIDVTGVHTWTSVSALLQANGTQLTSFAISFIVIVAFWRHSHELISRFIGLDPTIINANIVVIGLVIFIPFTTEAMGDPELNHLPLPTALYAFNIAAAILANVLMFHLAARRGLLAGDDPPRALRAEIWDGLSTPAVFLLSIPVTYLGTEVWGTSTVGKLFWLVLLVVGPISGHYATRAIHRARADAGLDVTADRVKA